MSQIRVGLVGCGYWGKNLARTAYSNPASILVALCDYDRKSSQTLATGYPGVDIFDSVDALVASNQVDAVMVATPVEDHFNTAKHCLEAGKHVLLEKPFTTTVEQADELVKLSEQQNLVLMVDHPYVYSPAATKISQLISAGEIGPINYIDSVRVNLGKFQRDVNVVYDLAPHDLSLALYFLGSQPESVTAVGKHHKGHGALEDIAFYALEFANGTLLTSHINWLSPVKIRRFVIGGEEKTIVWDDLIPDEKVKVYDRGVDIEADVDQPGLKIAYRMGNVVSPNLPFSEPLAVMMGDFCKAITHGNQPLSDMHSGRQVVKVISAINRSIALKGQRVDIDTTSAVHKQAS